MTLFLKLKLVIEICVKIKHYINTNTMSVVNIIIYRRPITKKLCPLHRMSIL